MRLFFVLFLWTATSAWSIQAQEERELLYDVNLDGLEVAKEAVALASQQKKHVLLQIGGNWCGWCIKLHDYIKNDPELDSLIQLYYVSRKINYSDENYNFPLLKELAFPQRFGFPVLIILDDEGNLLHTQDSAYLESGSSYDRRKFRSFILNWTQDALDPERYLR